MADQQAAAVAEREIATRHEGVLAREAAADERERRADERQRLAEERERGADERERLADEREILADGREFSADDRERLADAREEQADERQRIATVHQRELAERARITAFGLVGVREQALADIDHARELLARSAERLNRREAAVQRDDSGRSRHQAQVGREAADTERALTAWQPDPGVLAARRQTMCRQARLALRAFLAHEGEIARAYEELAAGQPSEREEYRAAAEQARETARRVREVLRTFDDLTSVPD